MLKHGGVKSSCSGAIVELVVVGGLQHTTLCNPLAKKESFVDESVTFGVDMLKHGGVRSSCSGAIVELVVVGGSMAWNGQSRLFK